MSTPIPGDERPVAGAAGAAGTPPIATGGLRAGSAALAVAFGLAGLFGAALSVIACVLAAQVPNIEVTQGEFSSPPANWSEVAELVAIAGVCTLLTGAVVAGACAFGWFAITARPLRRKTGVIIAVTPAVVALAVMGAVLFVNRGEARPGAFVLAPEWVRSTAAATKHQ